MITAVDTTVLSDILGGDPTYARSSLDGLRRCLREGRIVACDIDWSEIAAAFPDGQSAVTALARLGVHFNAIGPEAAALAGQMWRSYRMAGGTRERMIPDFLIGAHAVQQADRLLTRDHGFQRRYFPGLLVIDPTPS
ncbi:MAG: type II toxin-antitoxin system VapC family toxin [Dehalococcoidia bacterium]